MRYRGCETDIATDVATDIVDLPTPGNPVPNNRYAHYAVLTCEPGSSVRHAPLVELTFPYNATVRRGGPELRDWVKDTDPDARWNSKAKCWTLRRLGRNPSSVLRSADFVDIFDVDGQAVDIDSLGSVLVEATPDHPGMLAVYPRLIPVDKALPLLPDSRVWQQARNRWVVPARDAAQLVDPLFYASVPVVVEDSAHEVMSSSADLDAPAPDTGIVFDATLDGLRAVPVTDLNCVDHATAQGLDQIGVTSLYELLHTSPRRYIDRSNPVAVSSAENGDEIAFIGTVTNITAPKGSANGKGATLISVTDSEGTAVNCRWFNARWVARRFDVGGSVVVFGTVETWAGGSRVGMTNPLMDPVTENDASRIGGIGVTGGAGMIPVYPQSAKANVSTWQIRRATAEAIERMGELADPLAVQAAGAGLVSRTAAYSWMHAPDTPEQARQGRDRLAFDELTRLQLSLMMDDGTTRPPAVVHTATGTLTGALRAKMPWPLTGAQDRALAEIGADMCSGRQMNRLLQGDVGAGKAQPLDALVLTPSGFVPMGQMYLGAVVVTPAGGTAEVTGVFPQGVRPVYRVGFSDGSVVRADAEHLWSVRTSTARHRGSRPKNLTTTEIMGDLRERNGASKWHVDLVEPADFDGGGHRPIDPYLLGMLLGDGGFKGKSVNFTSADPDMVDAVRSLLPTGCVLKYRDDEVRPYDYKITGDGTRPGCPEFDLDDEQSLVAAYATCRSASTMAAASGLASIVVQERLAPLRAGLPRQMTRYWNPLTDSLHELGLMGHGSHTKFVPQAYRDAPVAVRLAVLQGLLDTDGTLDYRRGHGVSFSTVSEVLARDVEWLARSLGGRAKAVPRNRKSGFSWHVSLALPSQFAPFRCVRKAAAFVPRSKYATPAKAIVSIEYAGDEPTQCIMVDDPEHLYVTDHFTRTHNTATAVMSLLVAVESGHQGALVAPTTILAIQHFEDVTKMCEGLHRPDGKPVNVALMTDRMPVAKRRPVLTGLADGSIDIVVGTKAVMSTDVAITDLSLVVIDEQHKFGVEQRQTLAVRAAEANRSLDMLIMTATPVPRTAVLTSFGDLTVSVLDEMPPGRTPIKTYLTWEEDRVWAFLRRQVASGRQGFVVAPLVTDSETRAARGAEDLAGHIAPALPGVRIDYVHGKQKAEERGEVMGRFERGEVDVLVATTVIEVGVNVPNATVMVITGAEDFGLAQLHQLRGRVGRGKHAGTCFLLPARIEDELTETGRSRLDAMVETTDGFVLSERDLAIRGPGTLIGSTQSGAAKDLRVANLLADTELIEQARTAAAATVATDPSLGRHPVLRSEVWGACGTDAGAWLRSA